MKKIVLFLILSFLSCQPRVEQAVLSNFNGVGYEVVELPTPNSGKFSYQEAEAQKQTLYQLLPSKKYWGWRNPTTGGAIHINKNDEIEVYQAFFSFLGGHHHNHVEKIAIDQLHDYINSIGFGNHASVLITSEIELKNSTIIDKILKVIFRPGIQIYYLEKRNDNE